MIKTVALATVPLQMFVHASKKWSYPCLAPTYFWNFKQGYKGWTIKLPSFNNFNVLLQNQVQNPTGLPNDQTLSDTEILRDVDPPSLEPFQFLPDHKSG